MNKTIKDLEDALKESEADLAAGKYKILSPEEHIKELYKPEINSTID